MNSKTPPIGRGFIEGFLFLGRWSGDILVSAPSAGWSVLAAFERHRMKNQLLPVLIVAVVALGIAGFVFLNTASTEANIVKESRIPSLVSGIACLVLATGLLVFGLFVSRRRDEPPRSGPP
jgi:hypothetical protein